MSKGLIKLRPLYMSMIIFAFTLTMYNAAHFSVNSAYGAQNNETVSIKSEYHQLRNNIHSKDKQDKGLLEKVKTLSDPLENPFATIGAGLYILPQLLGVLTGPLQIGSAIIGSIFGALSGLIPSQVPTFLTISLALIVTFSLIEIGLRIRRA